MFKPLVSFVYCLDVIDLNKMDISWDCIIENWYEWRIADPVRARFKALVSRTM